MDGIVFRHGTETVRAIPENVSDTSRCTRLGGISTIEHLMSAFCGLEVTDADVEVSGPEMPAMCGSAFCFGDSLISAGFADLTETELDDIFTRIFVQEDNAKIGVSHGTGCWRYEFAMPPAWGGEQIVEIEGLPAGYMDWVAPARTFAFEQELAWIRANGLGRGLDETTAFVIGDDRYLNEVIFIDEPARHKLLDAMGDLYLAGVPARFLNVVAHRTGHKANVQAASLLYQAVRRPA